LTIRLLFILWGLLCPAGPAPCGEESFIAHPQRSIQLARIRPGNLLVFEYGCQTEDFQKTIARDVGVRHALVFEVDPESHAFFLEDEALASAKVYMSRHCRCRPFAYDHLEGTIEGHRTAAGQWEVTLHVAAVDAQGKEIVRLDSTGVYRSK
jgi:hypothetical protein